MVGHLDDRLGRRAPELRVRLARPHGRPGDERQATGYFGEAPSSEAACDFRDDCEAFHAGDEEYASQIWYWSTPIAECLDGRTDVECTDYSGVDDRLAGDQGLS